MKAFNLTACLAPSWAMHQVQATAPLSYMIMEAKPIKDASIQIISFDAVAGLDQNAIRKVNEALIAASSSYGREAKECSAAAQCHPWEYKLAFDKVLLSEKYLSVVFNKSTVCTGSPDIEKEARVFPLPTGTLVPAKTLFKRIFPAAKLATGVSSNKELID